MAAATQSEPERIAKLEQQVEDLANLTGQLIRWTYGERFSDYNNGERYLEWHVDPPDPDDGWVDAWWSYNHPAGEDEEAEDAS